MKETFINTVYLRSSFNGKKPSYTFTPFPRDQMLEQINEKIYGGSSGEISDQIKNEIINRIQNFATNKTVLEAMFKSKAASTRSIFNMRSSTSGIPDPNDFSDAIKVYKAIQGGQVSFPYLVSARVYRTQYFWFNLRYQVSVLLSGINFCKKTGDQFALDLSEIQLDPKWQNILVSGDPKSTYCDSLQISLDTANIFFTQVADGYFLTPEAAAEYANNAIRDDGAQNLVPSSFGPIVNSNSALAMFQAMADQSQPGETMYGFLGQVVGFATKYTTLDGPLLECGWVIPLTADINSNQVLAALSNPLFRIGLNEARQLATNPYGYFETIKNSLTAAGFGPTIPTYSQIDQDIRNKALPTKEQTRTDIDLNGTTDSNLKGRETGSGTVQNAVEQGGNTFNIVNGSQILQDLRQNGRRTQGY
jgi:hypothetical protein